MTAPNDTDIVSALKENAENGFRLLMAKYKEAVYWHKRKTCRLRIFAVSLAVAASIALLLVFSPVSHQRQTDSFSKVEQAFANLSREDQAYMLAVYQEDLFMNE